MEHTIHFKSDYTLAIEILNLPTKFWKPHKWCLNMNSDTYLLQWHFKILIIWMKIPYALTSPNHHLPYTRESSNSGRLCVSHIPFGGHTPVIMIGKLLPVMKEYSVSESLPQISDIRLSGHVTPGVYVSNVYVWWLGCGTGADIWYRGDRCLLVARGSQKRASNSKTFLLPRQKRIRKFI